MIHDKGDMIHTYILHEIENLEAKFKIANNIIGIVIYTKNNDSHTNSD